MSPVFGNSGVPNLAVRAVVEFARIPSLAVKEGNSGESHYYGR
jgi:hypothetical protein